MGFGFSACVTALVYQMIQLCARVRHDRTFAGARVPRWVPTITTYTAPVGFLVPIRKACVMPVGCCWMNYSNAFFV